MDSEAFIRENFEELSDREIARELDIPESEVEEMRKKEGFLRLESFAESGDSRDLLEVSFDLDDMRKRQLQGFVGEKVCSLMENRVMELLDQHVKEGWTLRDKAHLLHSEKKSHGYFIGGRPGKGDVEIEGNTVKHFDAGKQQIVNEVRDKCVVAEEEIFRKFSEVKNPWIDFSFYAFNISGTENRKFECRDFSESYMERDDSIEVEIPFIEDFKIVALEVKTTREDEEKLLSENQRKVREIAQGSPFIDFFTLKVETDFQDLDIPESFDGRIEKHS